MKDTNSSFLVIEGNGRIAALKQAYPERHFYIEVEVITTRDMDDTLRALHSVMKSYGLEASG